MQRFMGPPLGPIPMQPFPVQSGFMQAAPMFGGQMAPNMLGFGATGAGRGLGGLATAGRSGGLLARLFGGGASQAAGGSLATGIGRAATGAGSGMNLTTVLQNTQRILGLTQQVVPMVQQYGPLIRNMPTIWRIMRSNDTQSPPVAPTVPVPVSNPIMTAPEDVPIVDVTTPDTVQPPISAAKLAPKPAKKTIDGLPVPKLYI